MDNIARVLSAQAKNQDFRVKAEDSLRNLFAQAQSRNEVQFALSINPEFRGTMSPGWNGAEDAHRAFDEYFDFVKFNDLNSIHGRVALAFYSHLAEASGFYEMPKNLLRLLDGSSYLTTPFRSLSEKHNKSGDAISPNSNKIIKDLVGHASLLGLTDLAQVLADAFDPEIRNGYAHADYVIWNDGLRLPKRNGGTPRLVTWPEFILLYQRAMMFFAMLADMRNEFIKHYLEPKICYGMMNNEQSPQKCVIHADAERRTFTIRFGG